MYTHGTDTHIHTSQIHIYTHTTIVHTVTHRHHTYTCVVTHVYTHIYCTSSSLALFACYLLPDHTLLSIRSNERSPLILLLVQFRPVSQNWTGEQSTGTGIWSDRTVPDCVRSSCCSPTASTSAAVPRLRLLQLVAPRLCPLQLLLPNCLLQLLFFSAYATLSHKHSTKYNKYEGRVSLP